MPEAAAHLLRQRIASLDRPHNRRALLLSELVRHRHTPFILHPQEGPSPLHAENRPNGHLISACGNILHSNLTEHPAHAHRKQPKRKQQKSPSKARDMSTTSHACSISNQKQPETASNSRGPGARGRSSRAEPTRLAVTGTRDNRCRIPKTPPGGRAPRVAED